MIAKVIRNFLPALFLLLLSAGILATQHELPDQELADAGSSAGLGAGLFVLVLFLLIFVLVVVAIIFWVWMIIDCIKRDFKDKVLWILILVFTGAIGAILYYFIVKRANK